MKTTNFCKCCGQDSVVAVVRDGDFGEHFDTPVCERCKRDAIKAGCYMPSEYAINNK